MSVTHDRMELLPELLKIILDMVREFDVVHRARLRHVCKEWRAADDGFVSPLWTHAHPGLRWIRRKEPVDPDNPNEDFIDGGSSHLDFCLPLPYASAQPFQQRYRQRYCQSVIGKTLEE